MIALAIFFLAPLWYIFEFSTGLKYFAPKPALAVLNGELTAFSGSLWSNFFGKGVELHLMPNIGSGVSFTFPAIVLGILFVVLILGAVMGNRFGEYGALITGVSFVLLLAPFLTFPFGNTLLRVAQLSSESTDLRLFFKSVSMATTSSVIAVLIAFPVAYYLAFCVEKSKYTWLLIVITPFLTSYLLRIFAWKVILGDQGLINSALFVTGLRDLGRQAAQLPDLQPVHGDGGAARTPGCRSSACRSSSRWRTWTGSCSRRPPTSARAACGRSARSRCRSRRPGIVAAFLFVFIPSIGEYITPSLVGGTQGLHVRAGGRRPLRRRRVRLAGGSVLALFLLHRRARS